MRREKPMFLKETEKIVVVIHIHNNSFWRRKENVYLIYSVECIPAIHCWGQYQWHTVLFTADVNYSDKSAHLFSTDGFYCFTLTCFMDSYTKIVSSKFIVDSSMVLLGQLSTLFQKINDIKHDFFLFFSLILTNKI